MSYRIQSLLSDIQRLIGDVDREQFLVISIVVLAVGGFMLRGFGSRTGY